MAVSRGPSCLNNILEFDLWNHFNFSFFHLPASSLVQGMHPSSRALLSSGMYFSRNRLSCAPAWDGKGKQKGCGLQGGAGGGVFLLLSVCL